MKKDSFESFSQRLIEEREKSGYSAEEFATLAGVGKTAQYNYEKGRRKPDLEYLYNISNLGHDIQYIATGVPSDNYLTDQEKEFLLLYRKADKLLQALAKQALKLNILDEK